MYKLLLTIALLALPLYLLYGQSPQDTTARNTHKDSVSTEKNNEQQEPKDTVKRKWILKYRISLDGTLNRGNVRRELIAFRNNVTYGKDKFSFDNNFSYTFGKQRDVLAEEEIYNNLTTHKYLTGRLYVITINTIEKSHLRAIDFRYQGGAGLGMYIRKSDTNSLNISNAILYESTDFARRDDFSTIRNSTRIKGSHQLRNKQLILYHETFIQPSILDFSNFIFKTNITVSFALTKLTSLKMTLTDSYETVILAENNEMTCCLRLG